MELEDFKASFGEVEIPEEVIQAVHGKVSEAIKEAHNGTTNRTLSEVDSYIAGIAGIEKEHGEMTKDFVARALKAQVDAAVTNSKTEINSLKEQIAQASKSNSGVTKEQVEQLQQQLVDMTEKSKQLESDYTSKLTEIERKSRINTIVQGLSFDDTHKDSLLELAKAHAYNKAVSAKTVKVGEKEYVSEDGVNVMLVDGKALGFDEYVKSLHADILAPAAPKGNGSNSDAGQTGQPIDGANQIEAYQKLEAKLKSKNVGKDEARAKLRDLVNSDAYNALPQF